MASTRKVRAGAKWPRPQRSTLNALRASAPRRVSPGAARSAADGLLACVVVSLERVGRRLQARFGRCALRIPLCAALRALSLLSQSGVAEVFKAVLKGDATPLGSLEALGTPYRANKARRLLAYDTRLAWPPPRQIHAFECAPSPPAGAAQPSATLRTPPPDACRCS